MARLSEENFKDANNTPPGSRFRRIISRASRRSSADTTALGAAAMETDQSSMKTSPVSEQLRRGFSKVGLFPSERASETQRASSPIAGTEHLASQAQELEGVEIAHPVDTSLPGLNEKFRGTQAGDEDPDVTAIHLGKDQSTTPESSVKSRPDTLLNDRIVEMPSVEQTKAPHESVTSGSSSAATPSKEATNEQESATPPTPYQLPKTEEESSMTLQSEPTSLGDETVTGVPGWVAIYTEFARSFDTQPEPISISSITISDATALQYIHNAQLLFWICFFICAMMYGPIALLSALWYVGVMTVLFKILEAVMGEGQRAELDLLSMPFYLVFMKVPSAIGEDVVYTLGGITGRVARTFEAGFRGKSKPK